ncbi:MAG: hypothetical protein KGS44_08445 [Alphaproteobacteria bacterium]|jgi:hypothetical protein|nr:hypothetical protein [Alphaproteobacteria bacterium]
MTLQDKDQFDPERPAVADDVRQTLGQLEDALIVEILDASPTLRDLADAALWHRGDGDLIAREHRAMSARAEVIIDILAREAEEGFDERPPS